MNVHIERNWASRDYEITFYERRPLRVMRLVLDILENTSRPAWNWEAVDDGAQFPPTVTLPEDALAALLQEAEKVIPATHATERHLTDAVAVRDRLLALVEEGWHL